MPDGTVFDRPMRRHYNKNGDISGNYDKIQPYMEEKGLAVKGKFGNADCVVEKAKDIYDVTAELLKQNIDFFGVE